MIFKVRQRVFSFGDTFTIVDTYDMDRYQVQGKVFSLGDKLSFQDMEGRELYYIEQKLMRLLSEYDIYRDGIIEATCKKRFTLLGSKFDISSRRGNYTIEGRPLNYNYQVYRDDALVATVDKQFFSFTDTYGVDINDDEDYGFILSLVIVIDQVVHSDKSN